MKIIKVKNLLFIMVLIVLLCTLLSSCDMAADTEETETTSTQINKGAASDINNVSISDNPLLYRDDDDTSVVTMYLTVRTGNAAESTNHTWSEVNAYSIFYYLEKNIERYAVEGIIQVGDETGPLPGELGYSAITPNATVQVRGNTSSVAAQKSYKIELDRGKGKWRDQRTIILNKHIYDPLRFRNKLSYDLLKTIPGTIGSRSQFVHLYVKDETAGSASTEFTDYGLYTQVEQMNTTYLKNHGLDDGGQLYKAEMFEFYRYEDNIKLTTAEGYNLKAFEEVMEVKGNEDHSKLIAMLDDLNNFSMPVETVFEKYFDEENYFTWLAFHILIGNVDTASRNFYLYSPTNSSKFYFISWDNDGGWDTDFSAATAQGLIGHEYGISNYWGSVLHSRVLRSGAYRAKLDAKIGELYNLITKEKVEKLAKDYSNVVLPYVYSMPDMMYARVKQDVYMSILAELPNVMDYNFSMYKKSLEYPMPFFISTPEVISSGNLLVRWGSAFDFDNEEITYTIELSDTFTFENIIFSRKDVILPRAEFDMLPDGQYFVRVSATNASGKTQAAFDHYVDRNNVKHYGTVSFFVTSGTILRDN